MTAARLAAATSTGAALLLLVSCSAPGPTGYRPLTGKFGYTQERVDQDTWRVVYYANPQTPRSRVEEFALYRAARLARDQGATHFAVMDRDFGREEERRSIHEAPPPGFEPGGAGLGSESTISPTRNDEFADRDVISVRLRAELLIRPYDNVPPPGAMRVYVTDQALGSLAPTPESAPQ